MSWFVVGGIAVGATAGAIVGSKKGGDDVWKDALIGGAIGGTAGYGAGALGAAEAAAPAAVAGEGGAGILGAEGIAGGAIAPELVGVGGSMAAETPAGLAAASQLMAPEAATAAAPAALPGGFGSGAATVGETGGFAAGAPAALPGSSSGFGGVGSAEVGGTGGFAPASSNLVSPSGMVQAPQAAFGSSSLPTGATPLPGGGAFGGSGGATVGETGGAYNLGGAPQQSALEKGFGSAMSWLSEPKNAMLTGVLGLGALSMFNKNNEDNFGGSNVQTAGYPLSPNFQPSRYRPTRTYADGGITSVGRQTGMFPQSQMDRTQFATPSQMPVSREIIGADYDAVTNPYTGDMPRFASGKLVDSSKYQAMIDPRMNVKEERAPRWVGRSVADVNDPGIYIDRDEDTAYQDALTAAQTRMGKAAKGANVQLAAMQKPTPMGKLNLGPVAGVEEERKASGGITSLGGYAHGGNARLLRGPGDGMSDDIPATIADKQPARLADGEFVVPADVVSGLGNGSTEAGAKKLHKMMDKVRVDRTGTKKQGKKINADKYVPGMAKGGIASYADGGNVDYSQYYVYDANGNQVPMSTLLSATQAQTAPSSTASTKQQGYNPNYYNPQYYQNQLQAQQWGLNQANSQVSAAEKNLTAARNSIPTAGYTPDQYDLSNLSDTAKQNQATNAMYQQYLGRNIGQNEPFTTSLQTILSSPEYAQRKPYIDALNAAQSSLSAEQANVSAIQNNMAPIQQSVDRLANSSIKYNPYTVANRPSADEPQFYGNIYKGQAPDYSTPGYTLTGGNLGEWSNVAGETARAAQPASKNQQITQAYLQGLGRAPDTGGFNYWMGSNAPVSDIVKDIQTSQEARQNPLAVAQYYQDLLGRAPDAEGLKFWQTAANAGVNPQLIQEQMKTSPEYQVRQMYQQNLGRTADQAGQQFWTNAITQQGYTPEQVATAIKNTDEGKAYATAHPKEEKKRKGGIASLKRRK